MTTLRHGFAKRGTYNKFYQCWGHIKSRCYNKNVKEYRWYGKKGIKVCKHWQKFENFKKDMLEEYLKHMTIHGEKNTTIDRIDSKKNYCKSNCRWATFKVNSNNRKSNRMIKVDGDIKSLAEWSDISNTKYCTIKTRLNRGWPAREAVFTPPLRTWSTSKANY